MASQEELKTRIDTLIKDNKVMIFSKTYCPFCVEVKKIFEKLGVSFGCVELEKEEDGAAIQDLLKQKTGQRTVPNVFVESKHIGGCSDVKSLNQSNQLKKMLGV